MYRFVKLLFLFFFHARLYAQVLPVEGSALHYRIIGFSFPSSPQATRYRLEIAKGNFNNEDAFKKNIIKSQTGTNNKSIAEVPSFGSGYTWRIVCMGRTATGTKSEFHHFSTSAAPCTDTAASRLRVVNDAVKYKDSYVFLDGNRALYDMRGNLVWYLPATSDSSNLEGKIADLKLSTRGSITFLLKDAAYEINYNGDVLWKSPNNGIVSGGTSERYHHEFTRLANGHYMVLGSEYRVYKGNRADSSGADKNSLQVSKTEFGTIIEYDEKGNVTWSWKSADYFIGSDLDNYEPPGHIRTIDVHENSFYFDEKRSVIYVGFKNISRIVKIKYPEGNVLNAYGEIYQPGIPEKGNGLFCHQHSARVSSDGYLYLFNNNLCNKNAAPTVMLLQEPVSVKGDLKKVWEYTCPVDKNYEPKFNSGGNVIELPDHSFFVCMGSKDSKLFIVSKDKKILWSAVPERYNEESDKWDIIHQSRAGIIDRKELEQLIWNGSKIN